MTASIVNINDIKELFKIDPLFVNIHRQYGPPPNWNRPEGFVSLSRIILEQQVSLESAKATYQRLQQFISELTPENILNLTDDEMRNCYISRQKAGYLRELSNAVLSRQLEIDKLRDLPFDECRKQLLAIKGIGNWTADIYQMICLQEKDIFPPGDVAVINAIRHLTDLEKVDDIIKFSEKWKPLRSLAAFYFWHHHLSKRGKKDIY